MSPNLSWKIKVCLGLFDCFLTVEYLDVIAKGLEQEMQPGKWDKIISTDKYRDKQAIFGS